MYLIWISIVYCVEKKSFIIYREHGSNLKYKIPFNCYFPLSHHFKFWKKIHCPWCYSKLMKFVKYQSPSKPKLTYYNSGKLFVGPLYILIYINFGSIKNIVCNSRVKYLFHSSVLLLQKYTAKEPGFSEPGGSSKIGLLYPFGKKIVYYNIRKVQTQSIHT